MIMMMKQCLHQKCGDQMLTIQGCANQYWKIKFYGTGKAMVRHHVNAMLIQVKSNQQFRQMLRGNLQVHPNRREHLEAKDI